MTILLLSICRHCSPIFFEIASNWRTIFFLINSFLCLPIHDKQKSKKVMQDQMASIEKNIKQSLNFNIWKNKTTACDQIKNFSYTPKKNAKKATEKITKLPLIFFWRNTKSTLRKSIAHNWNKHNVYMYITSYMYKL